jgi:hypothetical protein
MTNALEVLKEFRYPDCSWYPHEKESDPCRHCDSFAGGIISALSAAGLVIVPKVPTEKMMKAALRYLEDDTQDALPHGVWQVMVETASDE